MGYNCCNYIIFFAKGKSGCQLLQENDPWNITWPLTDVGETAKQKCPGGNKSMGT